MRKYFTEDQEDFLDSEDKEDITRRRNKYEKYTITVSIKVRATEMDVAEDAISDLVADLADHIGETYGSDIKIDDYDIDIEPGEIY
jgi:hypothetical protein